MHWSQHKQYTAIATQGHQALDALFDDAIHRDHGSATRPNSYVSMSSEDDLHEIRMATGQMSMDMADAIDAEFIDRILEAREPAIDAYRILIDRGITPHHAMGMMIGMLLEVIKDA